MMYLAWHRKHKLNISGDGGTREVIDNPSRENVIEAIQGLDNRYRTEVSIGIRDHEEGPITISGGERNRVRVNYFDKSNRWQQVIDPAYPNKSEEIELWINYDLDDVLIYQTLLKEKALEIALYYLEHQTLPNNLAWNTV